MKKVYFAASALFVAGIAGAQVQSQQAVHTIAPFTKEVRSEMTAGQDRMGGDPIPGGTDDFDTPANWTMPTDANGHAWIHTSTTPSDVNTYMGAMASTTAANGFAAFNGVQYLLAGVVDPQDAVLSYTPAINCSTFPAVTLKFQQRYRAFNSDQTFVEVSGDNGATYTQYEINTALATNGPAVQETVSLNVSAVAGSQSQVKVRFRWLETSGDDAYGSGYGWMVDDFGLYEAYNYDQEITKGFIRSGVVYDPGLDYYMIPTTQITSIDFSATRCNLGAVGQTGSKLNVTVDKGATVFTGTSTPGTLAFGACDSIGLTTTYTPASGLGVYDITMWLDQTNAEEITSNDSVYSFIEVTDYMYSRDNDDVNGAISAVSSNPEGALMIGNVFEIFANDQIGAIHVYISDATTNEGQLVYGQIYRFDGTDYVYVEATPDYTIGAGDVDNWMRLVLNNPVDVAAGDDLLIVAGHYGGTDPVEFYMAQAVDEGTVLGYIDGSLFQLTSPQAIMVRTDSRDFTGIDAATATNFFVGQNMPNPFNNTSMISYSLNEASNVSVTFTDVTGKVVKTVNQGTQDAGNYTLTVDGSDMAEGVYFYTFTIGDNKVTKQMIVSKK
ncbi:MAG: T9SS type A sorting domain-containing protein [Bacteroidetes bacterium]|nr:T9SS type A sorting domain-containing protein [Bacteroidota bacterium]